MAIQIESNVRSERVLKSRDSKYPFRELRIAKQDADGTLVGDSFFIAGEKAPNTLRNSAGRVTKATGFRFSIRAASRDGVKGARVWRVA